MHEIAEGMAAAAASSSAMTRDQVAAAVSAVGNLSKKLDAVAKTLTEQIEAVDVRIGEVEVKADQNADELRRVAPIRQKALSIPEILGDDGPPIRTPPGASQAVTAPPSPGRITESIRAMAVGSASQAQSLRAIEVATAKQAPIAEAAAASAKTSAIEIEKQTPLLHAVAAGTAATALAVAKGATAQQIGVWVQAIASGLVVVILGILGFACPQQRYAAPPPGYVLVPAAAPVPAATLPRAAPSR